MFQNDNLKAHLEQSSSISLKSLVLAEWNLNFSDNVLQVGNYKSRPSTPGFTIPSTYSVETSLTKVEDRTWYGYTDSEVVTNSGLTSEASGNPTVFLKKNETERILYSLSDCLGRFRPRSGINKIRFFGKNYLNNSNENMYLQPRYYLSSKDDNFKYWNSYRVEGDRYATGSSFTSTIVANAKQVSVTSTVGLVAGQPLIKTSGTGVFGINAIIETIDSSTQITLSKAHQTSGTISFTVYDFIPVQRGIANELKSTGEYYIEDAAPFVVYDEPVPANRIVVKIQTHASDYDRGSFRKSTQGTVADPFYENPDNAPIPTNSPPLPLTLVNQQTPMTWKIQYLDSDNNWQTAKSFNPMSVRSSGKRIIGSDGYVELSYGVSNIPNSSFRDLGIYPSVASLPIVANTGDAYLITDITNPTIGKYYYWTNNVTSLGDGAPLGYSSFIPTYGWILNEESQTIQTSLLTSLTSPETYGTVTDKYTANYRQIKFIKGIRIVVDTMSKQDSMFELIEMSPRLVADLSDRTSDYSITKIASDIGETGIAVGQLSASTGQLTLFDYDESLNEYNDLAVVEGKVVGSLISNISSKNLQIKFQEQIIQDTDSGIVDYFVPIKTMYVDGFPNTNKQDRKASVELRDLFFHFESIIAPSMMMRNVKLSKAIATMLDNIGFSNYIFYKNENENEDIIPYFYVAPETTVAEVLNDLARSTQTAMFFDEFNNFITMSKNYIMPSDGQRGVDLELYGTKDFVQNGITRNSNTYDITAISRDGTYVTYTSNNQLVANQSVSITGASSSVYNLTNVKVYDATSTQFRVASNANGTTSTAKVLVSPALANIIDISSIDDEIFNGGKVIYSNKHIQRSYGTIREASLLNNNQSYKYKPVLLWEVAGTENLRSINGDGGSQSSYALAAMPLNTELSNLLPEVEYGVIINNIIDFGQSIYWLTRYEGYFYANGEIIKYKGVEHTVQSPKITGLRGNLLTKSRVLLTEGNIFRLSVGQVLSKVSGTGAFGTSPRIVAIDRKSKVITLSVSNATTGNAIFNSQFPETNVWIESQNDYSNYLSKVPFNGKIFPTGRVKIYAEPSFNSNGNIVEGPVAKHGRMQFGTGTFNLGKISPSTHTVLNKDNEWLKESQAKTFRMDSKWMFTGNHRYEQTKYVFPSGSVTGAANQKTITLSTGQTGVMRPGWIVTGTNIPNGSIVQTINANKKSFTINKNIETGGVNSSTITVVDKVIKTPLTLGKIEPITKKPKVEYTSKDMFDTSYFTESSTTKTINSTVGKGSNQVSALYLTGISEPANPSNDYLSYVFKDYSLEVPGANTFGTRIRILGTSKKNSQSPIGAGAIDTVTNSDGSYLVTGTGGGIAIYVDTANGENTGYYFEITALSSQTILEKTSSTNTIDTIPNVFFYKVLRDSSENAVPVTLLHTTAPILVDDGLFPGMGRTTGEGATTVYDLSIKTEKIGLTRKFYLYINNEIVGTVIDENPIPITPTRKNIALFVRGKGKSMFEHVYAIQDSATSQYQKSNSEDSKLLAVTKESFNSQPYRKNLVNPSVIDMFISNVNTTGEQKQNIYYEEFGTIMRECAYFNVKYDKAYPALYSKISPTFNDKQGYIVSGFRSNPYTAEFLVFNVTDFALNLDESTGNYLRIQGITFTQQSAHELTVDEYLSKTSSLNNFNNYSSINNKYVDIQNNRNTYGRKDFSVEGTYIQSIDMANNIMKWMVEKVMVPKKSICLTIFANPMIQLGDIVEIHYTVDGVQQVPESKFVVYHIEYQRSSEGPSMTLYLSEVV
jgi:hypothetical protein